MGSLTQTPHIERLIYLIRGRRVMLDAELAAICGVPTKKLNQAVRRNQSRFPPDFVFQLTPAEVEFLRSQIGTSKAGRGGRRYLPYAFTEHGAVMLSSVLHTRVAIEASIVIARAFVKLKQVVATHRELARKVAVLERKFRGHDARIDDLFEAIKELMEPPASTPSSRARTVKPKCPW